jgi:hypothetical protein
MVQNLNFLTLLLQSRNGKIHHPNLYLQPVLERCVPYIVSFVVVTSQRMNNLKNLVAGNKFIFCVWKWNC